VLGTLGVNSPDRKQGWLGTAATVAAILVLASPALLVRYLPMTDLPQHFAVVSILKNFDDPTYGFAEYFELAVGRTLYLLPYFIVTVLAKIWPAEFAMRCLVFLGLITYPLALLVTLRSRGRPALLALLALPLMYNATVFWGFVHFNLAVGLSFFAMALFSRSRLTLLGDLALTLLCALIAATHLYGLLLLFGYAFFWLLFHSPRELLTSRRRELMRRLLPLLPGVIGAAAWVDFTRNARGVDVTRYPAFKERLVGFENGVLGGYQDWSETFVLAGFGLVFIFLAFRSLPFTFGRWSRLPGRDRAVYLFILLNLVLYLTLPLHIPTAKCIHFRHAVLAFLLIPLVTPADVYRRWSIVSRTLLTLLALGTIGNTWIHLLLFDHESESFQSVLSKIPNNPKLLSLTFEYNGDIGQTFPYLHYSAYVQAKKGGYISASFATFFSLSPVREKKEAHIPPTPDVFEWRPELYDYEKFGYYYDHVLVRIQPDRPPPADEFRYDLVYTTGPWRLYRKKPQQEPRPPPPAPPAPPAFPARPAPPPTPPSGG
jgi:hypothetical protein